MGAEAKEIPDSEVKDVWDDWRGKIPSGEDQR